MTEQEYLNIQDWLSKKLKTAPYTFSPKAKEGWEDAIKVVKSYLNREYGEK